MNLPNLTDLSPSYAALLARKDKLAIQFAATKDNALRLQRLMNSGADPYREKRIKALVDGTTQEGAQSVKAEFEAACMTCADIMEAQRTVERDLSGHKQEADRALCETIKPEHDRHMASLVKNLAAAHADWLALSKMRREMLDRSIGQYGVFDAVPDFLGSPINRGSDFAQFMRDAQRLGHGKAPKELQ